MENQDGIAYEKAKRKVKEIKGFYMNLISYCTVIPILIIVNLTFMPQFHWFWFSMLGWGVGLAAHAMSAFGYFPFLGRGWEERKLNEIMIRLEKQKNKFKHEENGK